MDGSLDLWVPFNNPAAPVNRDGMGHGWHCDFYFGYDIDAIEEDALNEKYCLQVLRILITRADTEIDELREDLVVLQSQLNWAEDNRYKEWSETSCTTLREKISCLHISLETLRNVNIHNEHNLDAQTLMVREPAESMCEIVKALFGNICLEKDEQPTNTIVEDSSRGSLRDEVVHSNGKRRLRNLDPKGTGMEEGRDDEEKKRSHLELAKTVSIVKNSSGDTMIHTAGSSLEEKKSCSSDSQVIKEEIGGHSSTPSKKDEFLDGSLKTQAKKRSCRKCQDSRADTSTGINAKDKLCVFYPEVTGEQEVRELSSGPMDESMISNSSLKPGGKGIDIVDIVKPADTNAQDSVPEALRQTNAEDSKNPKLRNIDLQSVQKEVEKDSKVDMSEDIKSLSVKKAGKSRKGREIVYLQCSALADKHRIIDSLVENLNHNDVTNELHQKEEQDPEPKEVRKLEISTNSKESGLPDSLKKKTQEAKRQTQSNPVENGLDSSSNRKRRRITTGLAVDNQSLKGSCSRNRKKDSIVRIRLSNFGGDSGDCRREESFDLTQSCPIEFLNESLKVPSFRYDNLQDLTLIDLQAIARQHRLKGFRKLRKAMLVQRIARQLGLF